MRRSGAPRRRTKLAPVNRARRAKRKAEAFGPQAELCRTLPCCACGAAPPSDPAHVRSRGAGGKDRGNVVPLCRRCHDLQHQSGWQALDTAGCRWIRTQAVEDYVIGLGRGLEAAAYGSLSSPWIEWPDR